MSVDEQGRWPNFRSQPARSAVLRQSLSGLRGAAQLRSGASLSGRHVLSQPLRRPRSHLSRPHCLQLRQEAGVCAEVRRRLAALRAPHDEPRVQRCAVPHARATTDRRRAHAARAQGDGARRGRAGRHAARSHGGAARRRSDCRLRRRGACRGDRQPVACAARGSRAAARLVTGNPGCAWSRRSPPRNSKPAIER